MPGKTTDAADGVRLQIRRYPEENFMNMADALTAFDSEDDPLRLRNFRPARRDANNLLSMLRTWQLNDAGATPGFDGSLDRALGAIRAKATVMAGQTDLYFTPEDVSAEAALIPGARFRVIPSVWGHQAGNGLNAADTQFIDAEIKQLLAS